MKQKNEEKKNEEKIQISSCDQSFQLPIWNKNWKKKQKAVLWVVCYHAVKLWMKSSNSRHLIQLNFIYSK